MNFNAIIAVLVLKGIITQVEGEDLVEHLNHKPQSTVLRDSIALVGEIIAPAQPFNLTPLGPVGPAQQAEELAARANQPVAPVAPPPTPLEPANTQGPENVTGPDQSGNTASLESEHTDRVANAAPEKEDTQTGESSESDHHKNTASDEPAKSSSVNKSKGDDKKK